MHLFSVWAVPGSSRWPGQRTRKSLSLLTSFSSPPTLPHLRDGTELVVKVFAKHDPSPNLSHYEKRLFGELCPAPASACTHTHLTLPSRDQAETAGRGQRSAFSSLLGECVCVCVCVHQCYSLHIPCCLIVCVHVFLYCRKLRRQPTWSASMCTLTSTTESGIMCVSAFLAMPLEYS